jgi:hypothetical protein
MEFRALGRCHHTACLFLLHVLHDLLLLRFEPHSFFLREFTAFDTLIILACWVTWRFVTIGLARWAKDAAAAKRSIMNSATG